MTKRRKFQPQVASKNLPPCMTAASVPAGIARRNKWYGFLALTRRPDGWWLKAQALTPDVPLWGPYDSRSEALEARRSYLRNSIDQIESKPAKRAKAR